MYVKRQSRPGWNDSNSCARECSREYVSRTRKRVILGHHVILQKGLKFAQHQS